MPIQLSEEDGGKLLNVHVSGKLTGADYEHFVPEFERLVGEHGKLRVLFDMTDFHGWDAGRYGKTPSSPSITSPTLHGSRWSGKRSGSTAWRRSANRSRMQQFNISITPNRPRRGRGWTRRSGFVMCDYCFFILFETRGKTCHRKAICSQRRTVCRFK